MNGWPINGMREHTAPEKLSEFLLGRGIKGSRSILMTGVL